MEALEDEEVVAVEAVVDMMAVTEEAVVVVEEDSEEEDEMVEVTGVEVGTTITDPEVVLEEVPAVDLVVETDTAVDHLRIVEVADMNLEVTADIPVVALEIITAAIK